MTRLARLLLAVFLLAATAAAAVALTAGPAVACSCVEPTIDRFQTMDHDVSFAGVVSRRQEVGDEVILTMRADRVFAGHVTRRVDVVGGIDGASCGLEAQDGDRLIVFGWLEDGEVTSDLCSTVTAPGKHYRQLSSDLGEGTAPAAGYLQADRRGLGLTYDQFSGGRAILGALGLTVLGYFVLRAWRARRRSGD